MAITDLAVGPKLTVNRERPSHASNTSRILYDHNRLYYIVIVEEVNSNKRGRVYLDHRVSHYIALWNIYGRYQLSHKRVNSKGIRSILTTHTVITETSAKILLSFSFLFSVIAPLTYSSSAYYYSAFISQ